MFYDVLVVIGTDEGFGMARFERIAKYDIVSLEMTKAARGGLIKKSKGGLFKGCA